jgi:hypothetical protein
MARRGIEYTNIEEDLVALFERLQAEMPRGAASLAVQHLPPNGVVVKLSPRNPASASVWAHAENGRALVDFGFGAYGPTWELPIEGDNPAANKDELMREVEEMCRAVMAGSCQHKRRFLSVTGSVQVRDRPYKITDLLQFRPKPPLHGTRVYQPYISS